MMLLLCRKLKKFCFVFTVYIILVYAETSTSSFSTAKWGSVWPFAKLSQLTFSISLKDSGENSPLDKGQPITCTSQRSHIWLGPVNGFVAWLFYLWLKGGARIDRGFSYGKIAQKGHILRPGYTYSRFSLSRSWWYFVFAPPVQK